MRHCFIIGFFIIGTISTICADELITTRVALNFPEAMMKLQTALKDEGYTLSRIQRVDIGLEKNGYKSDKYRLVFYGHSEEIQRLSNRYPELIPYLPQKIAIYAEGEETLLVATNPEIFINDPPNELKKHLQKWKADLVRIFSKLSSDS